MKTVVYYSGKTLENKIEDLKVKLKFASEEEKFFIENDIKKFEYGLKGENKLLYELKNSHIPMYILYDLNLAYKDYRAQIDYVIITNKNFYVLETKNYYGNLIIDEDDNFYRVVDNVKTSIYSPITQLNRHLDIIREFFYDQNGLTGNMLTNYEFKSFYRGAIISANESTMIKFKNKDSVLKNKIIRIDKVIEYLKREERKSHNYFRNEKEIKDIADKILSLNIGEEVHDEVNETVAYIDKDIFNLDEILRGKLRKYRYDKSKKLGYKPYYIFNDKTLNDLILKKPQNEAELKKICGISDIKIKKYGKDILKIINK